MSSRRRAALFAAGCSRPLCHTVWLAERAHQRLRGLLFRPPLAPGEGLWLHGVRSIHMFGMRAPIDVVFLDDLLTVTATRAGLKPNRVCVGAPGTRHTLEVAAGMIQTQGIVAGTRMEWRSHCMFEEQI